MTKIAFLIRALDYGGAQTQAVTLAKALDKELFDVTVVSFYDDGVLEQELIASGVRLISLNKRGRWDFFGFLRRLSHQMKLLRPDIVHGYLDIANLGALCCKLFCRSTKVIWGARASDTDLSYYDWLRRISAHMERLLSRYADLIIVNSHAGQAYLLKNGFPPEKLIVIPNGIDSERFRPDPQAGLRVREELGIKDGIKLIGIVGRLDPMKDQRTFLRAASLICQETADAHFVCVGSGDGKYAQELYHLCEQLGLGGKVSWAGSRSDMPAVYNALDVIVSSSRCGEGFSNVIGEAMACGVPCVVTDTGDSALIVGETGVVVPRKDAAALASGIRQCLKQNRNELRDETRSRIQENWSVQQLSERTESAILTLCRRSTNEKVTFSV